MTELFGLYEYRRDMEDFRSRIIPLVLSDAKLSSPEDRVKWAKGTADFVKPPKILSSTKQTK